MEPYNCAIKLENHTSLPIKIEVEDNRTEIIIHVYEIAPKKTNRET